MIYTLFSVIRQNTRTRMLNHVTLAVATTTQKATFHRTRNKCKREYVLLEAELHAIAIRKIRFGLPKSGNTKVVPRKTVYRHAHVALHNGLDAV